MAFMTPPAGAGAGGDFTPILSYKANQGRLYVRDRQQMQDGSWDTTETEVTKAEPAFAVDFGQLAVGWCHFVAGMAPQWLMVPYGQPIPPRPTSPGKDDKGKDMNYRNGFRVKVAGNAIGGVREFAGNSAALINGMNELHTAYEASPEAAIGKIPVVKLTNTIAVKAGQSTNFQPVFAIQAWVDRPDVLGPRTVPAPHAVAGTATPQQPQAPAPSWGAPSTGPVATPPPPAAQAPAQPAAAAPSGMSF